jgi:hypothetical protein
MKSLLKTLLRELAQLIKAESGEFQAYDRKVELLNANATSNADRNDWRPAKQIKRPSGSPMNIYFPNDLGHRRAPLDSGV